MPAMTFDASDPVVKSHLVRARSQREVTHTTAARTQELRLRRLKRKLTREDAHLQQSPQALLCTLRGLVKPTARRNVRARGPVSAEVAHAGTDAGDCREGSEHGPLGRQGDRQRSARNGDGGGSFSVQLLALSILQSYGHQKLPRNRGKFELLDGTISGIKCGLLPGLEMS